MEIRESLATLRAELRGGFRAVNARLDNHERNVELRHSENSAHFEKINGRIGRMENRATVLETLVAALQAFEKKCSDRLHALHDQVQTLFGGVDDGKRIITRVDLKWVFGLIGLGGSLVALAFKLAGKW